MSLTVAGTATCVVCKTTARAEIELNAGAAPPVYWPSLHAAYGSSVIAGDIGHTMTGAVSKWASVADTPPVSDGQQTSGVDVQPGATTAETKTPKVLEWSTVGTATVCSLECRKLLILAYQQDAHEATRLERERERTPTDEELFGTWLWDVERIRCMADDAVVCASSEDAEAMRHLVSHLEPEFEPSRVGRSAGWKTYLRFAHEVMTKLSEETWDDFQQRENAAGRGGETGSLKGNVWSSIASAIRRWNKLDRAPFRPRLAVVPGSAEKIVNALMALGKAVCETAEKQGDPDRHHRALLGMKYHGGRFDQRLGLLAGDGEWADIIDRVILPEAHAMIREAVAIAVEQRSDDMRHDERDRLEARTPEKRDFDLRVEQFGVLAEPEILRLRASVATGTHSPGEFVATLVGLMQIGDGTVFRQLGTTINNLMTPHPMSSRDHVTWWFQRVVTDILPAATKEYVAAATALLNSFNWKAILELAESDERTDVEQDIINLRKHVADGTLTADETVDAIVNGINLLAANEIAPPAFFALFTEGKWAEFVDLLLPEATVEFKAALVAIMADEIRTDETDDGPR